MTVNIDITKELKAVEKLIKSDFNKEKTILGLYNYIFKSDGKKIRSFEESSHSTVDEIPF